MAGERPLKLASFICLPVVGGQICFEENELKVDKYDDIYSAF